MEQHTAHRGKKEVSEDVRCLRCTVSETLTAGEFYRGSEPAQQSVSLPSPADTHYSRVCILAYTRCCCRRKCTLYLNCAPSKVMECK